MGSGCPGRSCVSWRTPLASMARMAPTVERSRLPAPPEGVSAEMLRRHVLALGGVAAFGAPVKGLGELLAKLGDPAPLSLPSRLFEVHVAQVRDLTQRLGEAGKAHGSNPAVSSAAAAWGMRLLGVPGPEPLKRALMAAVAELQIHAGWAGSDAGLYRRAMYHYSRALELATKAGDASMRRWQDNSRLGRTRSGIVLATIHIRTGESRGLQLAHSAITAVTTLSSHRARRRLEPLVAALDARPGSDTKELGRMARRVTTTRA
jgi:hypothetical protein